MLTGKYKKDAGPEEGTRFAAPGPFQQVWIKRTLNERNHQIVGIVLEEAGKLDVSPIALALAWNLSRPGVVAPIIGPKSVKQLEDNLAALEVTLPEDTVERIDASSEPRFPYPHDFMRIARQMGAALLQERAQQAR